MMNQLIKLVESDDDDDYYDDDDEEEDEENGGIFVKNRLESSIPLDDLEEHVVSIEQRSESAETDSGKWTSYQYVGRTGSVIPTASLAGADVSVDLLLLLLEEAIVYQGAYGVDYGGNRAEFQRSRFPVLFVPYKEVRKKIPHSEIIEKCTSKYSGVQKSIACVCIIFLLSNLTKYNRAILHSLLKQRSFGSFVQKTMQEKLDNCLLPFLDHVSKAGKEVDIQDVFQKFFFDIVCLIVLGFDANCLSFGSPNVVLEKAFSEAEDSLLYRHVVPHWLWKLQKWLQIGKEKKLFEGSKIVDKFLHEQITSKRKHQKKCSNNQEEEPFSDLLSIIMAQEWGKGLQLISSQLGGIPLVQAFVGLSGLSRHTHQ
ncbi:hypothetical protein L6164_000587 [Bauhinia variegata]|uniref:Uncharacterized protein n=1 Tax=Bauhinia variegata TaxID=167791 RepID=A0ACB9Q6W1_BAUVA|nr:hypothetical protein L6164_000587 [Bauhinia variegata]